MTFVSRFFLPLVGLFCLATAATSARAQDTGAAGQQVHAFYMWYLHELNAGGDPLAKKRAELSKYVSARWLRELVRLSKEEGGIDADPFICAQDWDKAWEKNIAVRDLKVHDDTAEVRVVLTGPEMNHRIDIRLVREAGTWKLDRAAPKF